MSHDLLRARAYIEETREAIAALDESTLVALGDTLLRLRDSGGTLWTMGNGGSASTASHMTCDVNKGIGASQFAPMRAINLNELMPTQWAWANDYGFENALRNHLEQLIRPGDVMLAMSGSGTSSNVVNAAEWAHENGYTVIALVGSNASPLSAVSDLAIHVASTDMQVIENLHLVVVHWLYKALAC